METVYGILIHDYIKNKSTLKDWVTDKYNALHQIEEMAYKYVYDKNGAIKCNIYGKDDHGKPYGYYMYRNGKKYLDKIKIKHKVVNRGYLYNTAKYETVISFSVIEIKREKEQLDKSFYVPSGGVIYNLGTEEGPNDPKRKFGNNFKILMDEVRKYKISKIDIDKQCP